MEATKHRTQISLEDWQYHMLLDESRKTRKSLSQIIRELVSEKFSRGKKKKIRFLTSSGLVKETAPRLPGIMTNTSTEQRDETGNYSGQHLSAAKERKERREM